MTQPCSNPGYFWVTYFILSSFCNFYQLILSIRPLLLDQFLSPYQSFVVLSNICYLLPLCYLLTLHFIYAPYKCTCWTQLSTSPVLSCARSLRQYTFLTHQASLAIGPFWYGGIDTWLGDFTKNNMLPLTSTIIHLAPLATKFRQTADIGPWFKVFFSSVAQSLNVPKYCLMFWQ